MDVHDFTLSVIMNGIICVSFLCVESAISIALVLMRPAMLHLLPGVCASECSPHLHLYGSYLSKYFLLSIITTGVELVAVLSWVVSVISVVDGEEGLGSGVVLSVFSWCVGVV